MQYISFEDGNISLGGTRIPGILASLSVDGKVKYDKQKVDGISGKSKTLQGWEDHEVVASLYLLTDDSGTCYDKLTQLAPLFKEPDGKADPKIYALVNRHAQARGVRMVVFDRLESVESDQDDVITVTLGFTEHRPPIIKTEAAAAGTSAPGGGASQDTPKADERINVDAKGTGRS